MPLQIRPPAVSGGVKSAPANERANLVDRLLEAAFECER